MTAPLPDLLTLDDVVELFPFIPRQTWYHWRATGQGPASTKLGRRIVYRRKDIEAWVSEAFAAGAPK